MVEKEIQTKIVEEVKRYLEKWGIPADVKIGRNVKKGEDALSVRAFVEVSNLRRIFVEYAGLTLKGLPENFNGWLTSLSFQGGIRTFISTLMMG